MGRARMSDARPECGLCVLDVEGSVATLTLMRSEVFNAMNAQLISEMVEVLEWARARSVGNIQVLKDENGAAFLRVLIMRGDGKHFCAGADINMMRDAGARSAEENREDSERLDLLFNSLWALPCFTIGCFQRLALGG